MSARAAQRGSTRLRTPRATASIAQLDTTKAPTRVAAAPLALQTVVSTKISSRRAVVKPAVTSAAWQLVPAAAEQVRVIAQTVFRVSTLLWACALSVLRATTSRRQTRSLVRRASRASTKLSTARHSVPCAKEGATLPQRLRPYALTAVLANTRPHPRLRAPGAKPGRCKRSLGRAAAICARVPQISIRTRPDARRARPVLCA